jgi:hypothetical protein
LVAKFGAQEAATASDEDFHDEMEKVRVAEFARLPIPYPTLACLKTLWPVAIQFIGKDG